MLKKGLLKNRIRKFRTSFESSRILNNDGLTLIELIISLVISLIVVGAAYFILLNQSGVFRTTRAVSKEQQRLLISYNAVKYSLRMAGFDYGQNYFNQSGAVPPVQTMQANYPNNPYELLVSYGTVVDGANPCILTGVANPNGAGPSSEFTPSSSCNIADFHKYEILNIINPVANASGNVPAPPITLCITHITAGKIQVNPGAGGVCPANPVSPKDISSGQVSAIQQVLYYWGSANYNFNPPWNQPGNLYECQVNPAVTEPGQYSPATVTTYSAPQCVPDTTILLDGYINNFSVVPVAGNVNTSYSVPQPYLYILSLTGESDVALSDSPAYSIHVPYNANAAGAAAKGQAGQVVGNNILADFSSNVFLRNVYYGS
jgi:prepilin-type N-terminal cleavage/methylation domain-containing protein